MMHHNNFISDQTKKAMAKLKKEGRKFGRPPFGFRYVDGIQTECDDQMKVVGRMIELRDLDLNCNRIMKILNEEKQPTVSGKPWTRQGVFLILSRFPMDSHENDNPNWIENEDGSGQWSDEWDGPIVALSDEEYRNLPIEDRSMDAFAPGVIDNLDIDIDDSV
tara:strand:- start:727 stop:1215 length:489 start_codon:yes stop_codon:yes gene_type:complete